MNITNNLRNDKIIVELWFSTFLMKEKSYV
jgi:hypothetical protein